MQESVKIEIKLDKIQSAFEGAVDELFKSKYTNPMLDLLKAAVNEKQGEIKKVMDEIVSASLNSPEFKLKMAELVLQRMVENSLRK